MKPVRFVTVEYLPALEYINNITVTYIPPESEED